MYRPRPYDSVCAWTHIYVTRLPYLVYSFCIITLLFPFPHLLCLIESSSLSYICVATCQNCSAAHAPWRSQSCLPRKAISQGSPKSFMRHLRQDPAFGIIYGNCDMKEAIKCDVVLYKQEYHTPETEVL